MSTAELNNIKLNLIGWINQLSDKDIISFLESVRISSSKGDWWKQLSDAEKKQILAGLNDADNGKILNSEAFWKKLNNG